MRADDAKSSLTTLSRDHVGARRAAGTMCVITAAALLLLILWGRDDHRATYDQTLYHLPTIRHFASQFPRPNLSNYLSATTPGYHLVVAAVARLGGWSDRLTALKVIGALFTVGLVGTTGWLIGGRVGFRQAVVLTLPLLCSLYVISSGVWLLPDNAGWWGVAGVMTVAMGGWRGPRTAWLGGALLLLTVLMRQSHLWAAAPLWAAAAVAPAGDEEEWGRSKRVAVMLLATLPSFAAVGYFFWLWGGPTPPSVRDVMTGGNAAAPAMVLAVIGVMTPFFLGYLLPARTRSARKSVLAALVGGVLGLIIGVVPRTSYSIEARRFSGLWNFVNHAPVFGDRSLLIIVLSCAGGVALGLWSTALPPRKAAVFLIAWAAFVAAQAANAMAFQRYYEPMVLITLALAVAHLPKDDSENRPLLRIAPAGPILLAILLTLVTLVTLRRGSLV
jgi:hypothetical protein